MTTYQIGADEANKYVTIKVDPYPFEVKISQGLFFKEYSGAMLKGVLNAYIALEQAKILLTRGGPFKSVSVVKEKESE